MTGIIYCIGEEGEKLTPYPEEFEVTFNIGDETSDEFVDS